MGEDVVKRLHVTFSTGLPLGTAASFTHDKELWIAYPATKHKRVGATIDRLLGTLALLQRRLIEWLNTHPDDALRVAMLLETIATADRIRREVTAEKCRAVTA